MTGTDDSTNPSAEAADPATPLTRLQHLAEHHPELRATIAANPSTYPGLIEWLGNLGDSEIDEAIAQRRARTAGLDPDEPRSAPTRTPTAERFGAAGAAGAAASGASRRPDRQTTESPAVDAGPARPITPPEGSATTTRTPDAPPRQVEEPRRAVPWAGILAVAAAVAVVVLGGLWIFNLPGDDDETSTNAGATDPAFPPMPSESATEEEGDRPAGGDDVESALAALEGLAPTSDCADAGADAEVVQAFASAAAPDGTWGDPAHGDRVVDSLMALADECDREHAQEVVDMILGDSDTNPALRTAIEADMSWLEIPEIPADAQQMPGFWVQGANMACVLSGSDVVCTIVDHSLDTPEGCLPGGISVEINSSGEAGVNCGRSANADPLLSDGDSAYNGDLACTVTGVDVECWSTETGGGFVLGPATLETY